MDTRLDSFTGITIPNSGANTTVAVYLLDVNGDFIPGSSVTITFDTTKASWRKKIANAMGSPYNSDPWPLPDGAAACYYKVISGPGVVLGRDAVFPRVSLNPTETSGQTLDTNVEVLYLGESGFLGKVRT